MADNLSDIFEQYKWIPITEKALSKINLANQDCTISVACKYWDAKEDVFRLSFYFDVRYSHPKKNWVNSMDHEIRGSKPIAFMLSERQSCYLELFQLKHEL